MQVNNDPARATRQRMFAPKKHPGSAGTHFVDKSVAAMKRLLTLILLFAALFGQAQQTIPVDRSLSWSAQPSVHTLSNGDRVEVWRFDGCSYGDRLPALPLFLERFPLSGPSEAEVELLSATWEVFPLKNGEGIGESPELTVTVEQERNRFYARVRLMPYRRNGSAYERMTGFSLAIRTRTRPPAVTERGGPYTYTSALSNGNAYKFGVAKSGVYKLDYNYLKNELGISDLDNIDPRTLRLYGNGGEMLAERTDDPRPDDLTENAIRVVGEQDGKFDAADYILFYATGPSPWKYRPDPKNPEISIQTNLYDNHAWYFIKTGDGPGLRVTEQPDVPATYLTETFDDVQRIEDELVNLLDESTSAQGSGKRWFGDYFLQTRSRNYTFNVPNLAPGAQARIRADFAGRSGVKSRFSIKVDGNTFSADIFPVSVNNNEASYAAAAAATGTFIPQGENLTVTIDYPLVSQNSEGWLDFIEINARRRLLMTGSILEFRDRETVDQPAARFRLDGLNSNPVTVWDVTDPLHPYRQAYSQSGSALEFGAVTQDVLRNFVAFYDNAALPKPEIKVGRIPNQNVHGLDNLHMLIVYHPLFKAQAEQLAEHRRSFSGLDVAVVDVNELFNEFSSGKKDPTAIRDLCRMLYDRNPDKFEFLLLFGDGSFDPKNNTKSADNLDLVPVFESTESFSPIEAHPSDDYFGLLSDGESGALVGAMDISVGRLTCSNQAEAQVVVDKIIAYDRSPATLGDWRLNTFYIGDDEDSNLHVKQAEKLSAETAAELNLLNLDKIYLDAYQQVSTSGGDRYPGAKSAINAGIFKGALIAHYIGHGGPRGWAQERVIDNNDIASWNNQDKYPLIITATCSFGGYDDYKTLTGGEQSLIKNQGGAIALYTTVRAVFIFDNNRLTDAVQRELYKQKPIGIIFRDAKNTLSGGNENNARRFTLLGDPAMYLALPEYRVRTTDINGKPYNPANPDTLSALETVSLSGEVTDTLGNLLNNFNGKVYITVFDKAQSLQTLGQDPGSPVLNFQVQRNRIFKGVASVSGGKFSVNFVVPKDINYAFGNGKISYYAEDGTPLDAAGADEGVIIGGNSTGVQDDNPPTVQVFLNTEEFVLGGITDNAPRILIKCADDYGMNVSGAGLGHDLTAVLDDNVQETIVLNDFYQSNLDDSRSGQAVFPLQSLAAGRHTLRVKGWDVANNSGEGYTEFIVAEDGKVALAHVLNYPNPFTTNTFFQFEHNLAGQVLDVQVSIFSVSGRLVKTILHSTPAEGFRVTDVQWDGKDDYGDNLARGVYLYRVKVRGTDLAGAQVTAESDIEKLVILK